jgi:hypothetical protein
MTLKYQTLKFITSGGLNDTYSQCMRRWCFVGEIWSRRKPGKHVEYVDCCMIIWKELPLLNSYKLNCMSEVVWLIWTQPPRSSCVNLLPFITPDGFGYYIFFAAWMKKNVQLVFLWMNGTTLTLHRRFRLRTTALDCGTPPYSNAWTSHGLWTSGICTGSARAESLVPCRVLVCSLLS